MSERSDRYGLLAEHDVIQAFSGVYKEIADLQFKLVRLRPQSKLLKLVTLNPPDGLSFSEDFADTISTLVNIPRDKMGNFYHGLGHYIDLLEQAATH